MNNFYTCNKVMYKLTNDFLLLFRGKPRMNKTLNTKLIRS